MNNFVVLILHNLYFDKVCERPRINRPETGGGYIQC